MLFNIYCLPIADIIKRHNLQYHMYADDTQLYAECSPSQHRDALLRNNDCVRELRQWLTNNKLLFNKDKTEAITFRSSSVRSPTVGSVISVCGATIPLNVAVRDTGVYLDMSALLTNACRGAYFHMFRIVKIRA